jgi:hypothetical protein
MCCSAADECVVTANGVGLSVPAQCLSATICAPASLLNLILLNRPTNNIPTDPPACLLACAPLPTSTCPLIHLSGCRKGTYKDTTQANIRCLPCDKNSVADWGATSCKACVAPQVPSTLGDKCGEQHAVVLSRALRQHVSRA